MKIDVTITKCYFSVLSGGASFAGPVVIAYAKRLDYLLSSELSAHSNLQGFLLHNFVYPDRIDCATLFPCRVCKSKKKVCQCARQMILTQRKPRDSIYKQLEGAAC